MSDDTPAKSPTKIWVILLVSRIQVGRIVLLSTASAAIKDKIDYYAKVSEPITADLHKARRFRSREAAEKFVAKDALGLPVIPPHYAAHIEQLELLPKKVRQKRVVVQTPFGPVRMWPEQTHFLDKVEAL